MIPRNVRSAARHEAAHATAAERLGGGWLTIWAGAGSEAGNGYCKPWGGPHALTGLELAAYCLAGIWADYMDAEPFRDAEEWVQVYLVHLEDRIVVSGEVTRDTRQALDALGLPPAGNPWTVPPALLDAAKLCHATMTTPEAQARVSTLTAALLDAWTPPHGGMVFAQPDGSLAVVAVQECAG